MRLTVLALTAGVRVTKNLRLLEIARVLVRLDHVASIIEYADYRVLGSGCRISQPIERKLAISSFSQRNSLDTAPGAGGGIGTLGETSSGTSPRIFRRNMMRGKRPENSQ
jgi:hypothetical protein